MRKLIRIQVVFLFLLTLCSCEKEIDKYYERPDWLRGNAWEYLEEQGNFSLFLQAVERAGYKGMLNGRSLCTVMAPTDEAFQKYLGKLGVSSVADISVEDLKVLTGYHIVKNAYEKDYMLEFIMDPSNEKPSSGEDNAYKFETNAQLMYRETVNPKTGTKIKIKPEMKYLPVISSRLFPKLKVEHAEENYKYFFPEVNWRGLDEQLYAQNAAIIEAGIPTDNGYVYVLDAVCEPLRTVYEALEKPGKEDFSLFLNLYNKFAEVFYASKNEEGDSLFTFDHYHIKHGGSNAKVTRSKTTQFEDELPSLASESAYHNEKKGQRADYFMNMTYCYNTFAPTTNALNAYFQNYFEGFASINDVPQLTLYYLFQPVAREEQDIILPEMFEKEGKKGIYGEKWMITRDNVVNAEFCANGILYGLNTVLEPMLFHGICKPMFATPDFSIMANIFFKADEFVTLSDDTKDRYSVLILADSTLMGDSYNMTLDNGTPYFNDNKELVKQEMEEMSAADMQTLGDMHIINGAIRDFSKVRYYATRNPFTYVYTGKASTGEDCLYDCAGNQLRILKKWDEKQGITNGVTYQVDRTVSVPSVTIAEQLSNHFPKFLDLLKTAELAQIKDKQLVLTPLAEGKGFVFALRDDALVNYDELKALPKEELAERLKYYFIPMEANAMSDYILPYYETCDGTYMTTQQDEENSTQLKNEYHKLTIKAEDEKLRLTNESGNSVFTDGEVPYFGTDGVVYGLKEALLAK